jgi:hypothetical protein
VNAALGAVASSQEGALPIASGATHDQSQAALLPTHFEWSWGELSDHERMEQLRGAAPINLNKAAPKTAAAPQRETTDTMPRDGASRDWFFSHLQEVADDADLLFG